MVGFFYAVISQVKVQFSQFYLELSPVDVNRQS
jgi:hypothetical protein